LASFFRDAGQLVARNPIQSNRPGNQVDLQSVVSQHLRQSPEAFATQIVQLEQPVLGHRVSESEEQIAMIVREDVRDAVTVSFNRDFGLYSSRDLSLVAGDATGRFGLPTGIEFRS